MTARSPGRGKLDEQNNKPSSSDQASNVDPLVGKVLNGRFLIQSLINRGGMGKVYRAVQRPLNRPVALKVLDVMDQGGEFRERFFKEANLCAHLNHPNTVRVYDYGTTDDGIFFIAMELLEGATLHQILQREAPIAPLRALGICRAIAGALAEAHGQGLVHRDIKPGNIHLVERGSSREFVKVIDFGLVKEMGADSGLSRTGNIMGSPMYMAPEQVHGRHVDARTDIYALGLILYYALCGKTSVPKGNPMAVLLAQVQKTPKTFAEVDPNLNIPPALEWVVQTASCKMIEGRFADMAQFSAAMKACEMSISGLLSDPLDLSLTPDGRVVLPPGVALPQDSYALLDGPPPGAGVPDPTMRPAQHAAVEAPGPTLSSKAPLLLAGGAFASAGAVGTAMLVVAAVGVWWFVGRARIPVEAIVAPPAAQEVARVSVGLTSEPVGADVERDGAYLGSTPLTLALSEGEPWMVTLSAPGYDDRSLSLSTELPEVHVKLRPVPVQAPSPGPAPTRTVAAPVQSIPLVAPTQAPTVQPATNGDLKDPWAK